TVATISSQAATTTAAAIIDGYGIPAGTSAGTAVLDLDVRDGHRRPTIDAHCGSGTQPAATPANSVKHRCPGPISPLGLYIIDGHRRDADRARPHEEGPAAVIAIDHQVRVRRAIDFKIFIDYGKHASQGDRIAAG